MSKILEVINDMDTLLNELKKDICNVTFDDDYLLQNIRVVSILYSAYELKDVVFEILISDPLMDLPSVCGFAKITNNFGKLSSELINLDAAISGDEYNKMESIFRNIDLTRLDDIVSKYKISREDLFDAITRTVSFKERRRINQITCSPINDRVGCYNISMKIIGIEKNDFYMNKLTVSFIREGIIEWVGTDSDVHEEFENVNDIERCILDFFFGNEGDDSKDDSVDAEPIKELTLLDKIKSFLRKIFKR